MEAERSIYCDPAAAREFLIEKGFSGRAEVIELAKNYLPRNSEISGFCTPENETVVKIKRYKRQGKKITVNFFLKGTAK